MLYIFFIGPVGEILVFSCNCYIWFLVLFPCSCNAEKTQVLLFSIDGSDSNQVPHPAGTGAAAGAGREHAGWKLKADKLWTSAAVYLWPA